MQGHLGKRSLTSCTGWVCRYTRPRLPQEASRPLLVLRECGTNVSSPFHFGVLRPPSHVDRNSGEPLRAMLTHIQALDPGENCSPAGMCSLLTGTATNTAASSPHGTGGPRKVSSSTPGQQESQALGTLGLQLRLDLVQRPPGVRECLQAPHRAARASEGTRGGEAQRTWVQACAVAVRLCCTG